MADAWKPIDEAYWLKGAGAVGPFWRELLELKPEIRLDPYMIWADQTRPSYVTPANKPQNPGSDKPTVTSWRVLVEQDQGVASRIGAVALTPPEIVAEIKKLRTKANGVVAIELATPRVVEHTGSDPPTPDRRGKGYITNDYRSHNASVDTRLRTQSKVPAGSWALRSSPSSLSGNAAKPSGLEVNQTTAQLPPLPLLLPMICVIDDQCNFASRAFGRRIKHIWNQNTDRKTRTIAGTRIQIKLNEQKGPPPSSDHRPDQERIGVAREVWRDVDASKQQSEAELYHDAGDLNPPRQWSHGSAVLDMLAGNDLRLPRFGPNQARLELGRQKWKEKPPSDLVFVQLPLSTVLDTSGASLSATALEGILYAMGRAQKGQSVIVNLSYGNHSGPHDGSSMFERALQELLEFYDGDPAGADGKTLHVVLPAGNSHVVRCHASHSLRPGCVVEFPWKVLPDDATDNFVEIWIGQGDDVEVMLRSPAGDISPAVCAGEAVSWKHKDKVRAAVISPHLVTQGQTGRMILVAVAPTRGGGYVETDPTPVGQPEPELPIGVAPHGVWTICVRNSKTSTHSAADVASVHAWVQRGDFAPGRGRELPGYAGRQSYFVDDGSLLVNPMFTLSGIATKRHSRLFVVGAMRQSDRTVSRYSAAGPHRGTGERLLGPDLMTIADESINLPGLLLRGVSAGSRVRVSGTSIAAPLIARLLYEHLAAGKTADSFVPTWGEDGSGHKDRRAEGQPEWADPIHRGQMVRFIPTTDQGGVVGARPAAQRAPAPASSAARSAAQVAGSASGATDDDEAGSDSPILPGAP